MRLVDWADEEGARFGRSLSVMGGRGLDDNPTRCAAAPTGTAFAGSTPSPSAASSSSGAESRRQLANAAAYLELHIEQGPVLE